MAVKIRFSRIGKTHAPIYRIVAVDGRAKRDGKCIENLGTYNPMNHTLEQWHADRIEYWVSQGAQKTDAVKRIEMMLKKGTINRPGMAKVVDKKKAISYASPKKVEAPAPEKTEEVVEAKAVEKTETVETKKAAPAADKEVKKEAKA